MEVNNILDMSFFLIDNGEIYELDFDNYSLDSYMKNPSSIEDLKMLNSMSFQRILNTVSDVLIG